MRDISVCGDLKKTLSKMEYAMGATAAKAVIKG